MPAGSCLCGNVKIQYPQDVEPMMECLCHCIDCRKISGSTYSTNLVIPGDGFIHTGSPKTFKKLGDSGKPITSFFCGDCGSTCWRESEMFAGAKIVKIGVIDGDEALENAKPKTELYARSRVSWVPSQPQAQDVRTA